MESPLEFKVFYDEVIRKPSENLAINKLFRQLIEENKASFTGRIYKSSEGVIIGNNQSLGDINLDYCSSTGYEILRRETDGGAVITNKDSILTYSLFFRKSLNNSISKEDYYKLILIPLSRNLNQALKGNNPNKIEFEISGDYYLTYSKNNNKTLIKENIPLQRHFVYMDEHTVQFDGFVNLKKPDVNEISKIINLREFYSKNGNRIILAGEKAYDLNGMSLEINTEDVKMDYRLKKSEKQELEKIQGLEDLLIKDIFLEVLINTLKDTFGAEIIKNEKDKNKRVYGFLEFSQIKEVKQEFLKTLSEEDSIKYKKNLGTCFVDLFGEEKAFTRKNRKNNKIILKK
ncbi:MAG: hypothetical protein QXU20_01380 [Candidatus Woesearchaeota archaeon]